MEIYLMQHGFAFPKDQDPEEGLSPEGVVSIHASGKALKRMGIAFDIIFESPKKRSQQTAAIIAEETGFVARDVKCEVIDTQEVKSMVSPEETVAFLSRYNHVNRIFIAGHLPSVAKIASFLLAEGSEVAIDFKNGGCCRIDVATLPTHAGQLKWYLTPEQLQLIAGVV